MENKESTIRSLIHNIEYKKLQYKILKDVGSGDKKSIDEISNWQKFTNIEKDKINKKINKKQI